MAGLHLGGVHILLGWWLPVPALYLKCVHSHGVNYTSEKLILAGHWWLMPVTLATQEAEIRRISV
jgi:hypothetical protein